MILQAQPLHKFSSMRFFAPQSGSAHWVKEYNNRLDNIANETSQLHELIDEATYAAQRLGFIEGMQFARDVMSNFKNIDSERETVLRDFLENIKSQE